MFGSAQIKSRISEAPSDGVVLIGVVVVVLVVLVGVESISIEDVLRLCFLVVVAGVLIGVADVGVGKSLETDDGLRR